MRQPFPIPADDPLHGEIARFERGGWPRLHFPPALEARYNAETVRARGRALLLWGALALLTFDSMIVGDYYMLPGALHRAVVVRFAMITPLALLVTLLASLARSLRVKEVAAAGLCVAAAVSGLLLYANVSPTLTAEAQTGMVIVLLAINCVLQLDTPVAAGSSALLFALYALSLLSDKQLDGNQQMLSAGLLFWVALLTVVANFSLTRERRFSYLLQLRDSAQRSHLATENAALTALSTTDRLTGLPNRRAYDDRLQELWQEGMRLQEPMSAVMVDIDYFKHLNDTRGHLHGDHVLQRVASLLQQALRAEGDFVARFGGEEFVVLLPNATSDAALKVAERMRTLVYVAGSPAMRRGKAIAEWETWATVSCGVATVLPSQDDGPAELIARADRALYHAKQTGRNRVCRAEMMDDAPDPIAVPRRQAAL